MVIGMNNDWSIADLEAFRRKNKLYSKTIGGNEWHYHDLTDSEDPLPFTFVFIHGTIGNAEIFWLQMRELSKRMRVIGVEVPAIASADGITSGLKQLLDSLGVSKIVLLGTSFGGFMSQYFATKYPETVKGLVLGNTFFSTTLYRRKYRRILRLSRVIPASVIKRVMKRPLTAIEHDATRKYLAELIAGLSKETLMARLKSFIFEDIPEPPKIEHVLLINTENDPLVPKELQTEITETYPHAQVFTFDSKSGHFPYLIRSGKYTSILLELVEKSMSE